MALNNSKPLIFISRVDEADDDDERAQKGEQGGGGMLAVAALEK